MFYAAQQKHLESFSLNVNSEILEAHKSPDSDSCKKQKRIFHWGDSTVHSDLTAVTLLLLIKKESLSILITKPLGPLYKI